MYPLLLCTYLLVALIDSSPVKTNGMYFQPVQQILIADQFIETQIFLPFPEFLPELDKKIKNISVLITQLRMTDNIACKYERTNVPEINGIAETWLLEHVTTEYTNARMDLDTVRLELQHMMDGNHMTSTARAKRIAPLLAAGATAALFGLGIGIGTKLNCGLRGIFGACPNLAAENKLNIKKSIMEINHIQDTVMEIEQNTNNKMFLVASHLSQISKSQKQLADTQEHNWNTVQKHLDILHKNTVEFGDCQQSLFMRTKILHQSIAISNVLNSMLTTIKQFRASVYAYRMSTLASFAVAVDHFIPLSLVPTQHLATVLQAVAQQPHVRNAKLQLAMPITEILSYYETKILTAVHTNELGLMLVVAVPMTRQPVAMTVYRGHHIPMPLNDSMNAITWNIETEYIAVAKDTEEIVLMTHKQLKRCIGSQSMAICYEIFPTLSTKHTCTSRRTKLH